MADPKQPTPKNDPAAGTDKGQADQQKQNDKTDKNPGTAKGNPQPHQK